MTRRSRLRGSDAAIDAIGELISAVRTRDSAELVLEGPAGSGKTRLLDEAASMALRSGLSVARGVAVAGDQLVPMGPVRDALLQNPRRRRGRVGARSADRHHFRSAPGAAPGACARRAGRPARDLPRRSAVG